MSQEKQVVSILIHWPAGPEFTEQRHNIWVEGEDEAAGLVAKLLATHEAFQRLYDVGEKELRHLGMVAAREQANFGEQPKGWYNEQNRNPR